jgi:hypothetical protein
MNQRIQEFADEAGADIWGDKVAASQYFDIEKFAELIVRECMNVLDPGEHQLIARFQARKWLAEHFGVKE